MLSCPRCPVVQCVGEDVCCSVVFGTLMGVFMFLSRLRKIMCDCVVSVVMWSSLVCPGCGCGECGV